MVSTRVRRFEVWLARLDPAQGSEIRKTRPVLVVSSDDMNAFLRTVVVCPLTSTRKGWMSRVEILFDQKPGEIALDQIRTVDKSRLVKRLGMIDAETARASCSRLQSMFAW
jgi:mRNA interferase MazF